MLSRATKEVIARRGDEKAVVSSNWR